MDLGVSNHKPLGPVDVSIDVPDHPITRGVEDFACEDEAYANMNIAPSVIVLARARARGDEGGHPAVCVQEGRFGGRTAYISIGHGASTFDQPSFDNSCARQPRGAAMWQADVVPCVAECRRTDRSPKRRELEPKNTRREEDRAADRAEAGIAFARSGRAPGADVQAHPDAARVRRGRITDPRSAFARRPRARGPAAPERELARPVQPQSQHGARGAALARNGGHPRIPEGHARRRFVREGHGSAVIAGFADLFRLGMFQPEHLKEARLLVGMAVTRAACRRATDDDSAALRENLEASDAAVREGRTAERMRLGLEFHRQLAKGPATRSSWS